MRKGSRQKKSRLKLVRALLLVDNFFGVLSCCIFFLIPLQYLYYKYWRSTWIYHLPSFAFFRITTSSSTAQLPTTSTCTAAKTKSTSTPCPSIPSTTKRQTEPYENSSTKFLSFSLFYVSFFSYLSVATKNYCQLMQLDCVYIFTWLKPYFTFVP